MSEAFDRLLMDLFTTALEGGIGYWSECEEYHWMLDPASDATVDDNSDVEGFYAIIREVEGHTDGGKLRIDQTVMRRGHQRALENASKVRWSTGRPPMPMAHDLEDWDFDAGDADCIVQYGLFGEVVFG